MPSLEEKILVASSIVSMLDDLPGRNLSSADSRILYNKHVFISRNWVLKRSVISLFSRRTAFRNLE